MRATILILAAAASSLFLASCTGDPTTGGIFWSESQAQQRLSDRQQTLDRIEGDTARARAQGQQKQRTINRLSSQR